MTKIAEPAIKAESVSRASRAATAGGLLGLLAFGSLIAFFAYAISLHTDFEKLAAVPLLGRLLLYGNYVAVLLQALFMIPVVTMVNALCGPRWPQFSNVARVVGICALVSIVALRALLLVLSPEKVSDIWFIGPMGFVGLWLLAANWLLKGTISRRLSTTGMIAGIGLVIAGLSFFFLLDLGALLDNPDAYGEDLDFHIGLWIGGVPGMILYAVWAILLGRSLSRVERRDVA